VTEKLRETHLDAWLTVRAVLLIELAEAELHCRRDLGDTLQRLTSDVSRRCEQLADGDDWRLFLLSVTTHCKAD